MTETTLFAINLATKADEVYYQNLPIYNRQKLFSKRGKSPLIKKKKKEKKKNGSQAGGRVGGGKLRKFRVPIDEQIAMVGRSERDVTRAYVQRHWDSARF